MRVLSLSCTFPNPVQPGLGIFVRSRLQALAAIAEVKVVAPVGVIAYNRFGAPQPSSKRTAAVRTDGRLEVFHPRWLYPPGGTCLNAYLLAAQVRRTVSRVRETYSFDIIDSHFGFPDAIAAALLAQTVGVPFTATLRGNETMHAADPVIRRSLRWALRRAGRVITVSTRLAEFAIALGTDPDRIRIIPNGIAPNVFYRRDPAPTRGTLGISTEEKVILSAGTLIELKGHHRVVRALKSLHEVGIPARLLIAGGRAPGNFEQAVRDAVTKLGLGGYVLFLGHVTHERMAELMSAADLLCLASTREGCPNVVHESLACGTPVVATDIGAVPNMIPTPEYGLVVPVNDQAALTDALRRALSTTWDHDSIATWGRSRSWDHVAREVHKELWNLVQA